jgi:hypothetical protein
VGGVGGGPFGGSVHVIRPTQNPQPVLVVSTRTVRELGGSPGERVMVGGLALSDSGLMQGPGRLIPLAK